MLKESKAKITSDTDQAVNALNGRIDFTNKDLWEHFSGGTCHNFWGFSHVFKCRYKWNLWRQKGFWWNVIWIFSCERWGWLVPSKTKMWKLGSVSPCTWQLQLIFHWKGSGRYTRESPHHAELFEWLLQRGEVANSGAFCGHEVGKVWEREEMPTDFWVWKQFLP